MRETQTITIGEHTFEVKTYATAREVATIQAAYFKGTKVEVAGDQPKISEFNPNVQYEVKVEMVRQMVVVMDGSGENIAERAQDVRSEVFDELTTKLDEILAKKKQK
jgi:hypothetical protein